MKPLAPELFNAAAKLPLIDTHNHLSMENFASDRDAVIERAQKVGVQKMVLIGAGRKWLGNEESLALAAKQPNCFLSLGLHPHDAGLYDLHSRSTLEELRKKCAPKKLVAIGETGLDYHYNFALPVMQKKAFTLQLELAAQWQLPFVVHTREAHDDTVAMLREHRQTIAKYGGIIHCFSEGPKEVERYLELGMHISFSGVVTFPKSIEVQAALRQVPLERMLIETDAPYLAPHPHRGNRCEPACLLWTIESMARNLSLTELELAKATTANAMNLLKL